MASVKMFCVLFTVTLLFGAIGANIDQDSAAPAVLKSSSSIFPASILRLYHNPPLSHPSHPIGSAHTPATSPSCVSPNSPTTPNLLSAPLPPSASAPIPLSDPISQKQPIVYRLQTVAAQKHPQASLPGHLSYDNPANGNRKLLNKVHVPLRHTYPVPLGATPLNGPENLDNNDKVPIDNIKELPSPNSSKDKVTGDNGDTDNSKNYITFNPKDLPYQPVDNIEASPIPVRPGNKVFSDRSPVSVPSATPLNGPENLDNKDKVPIDNTKESPSPNISKDKVTGNNGDTDNSKNYITFNPKDLPYQPVDNIEASPIPVRPGNKVFSDKSPVPVPSKNKDTSDKEDSDDSKDTDTLEPEDSSSVPADTSEDKVSEIQQDVRLDSETSDKPKETDLSDKELSNSDDENETSKVEEPQNPLKDLVLNGTSSTKPKFSGNDCTQSIKSTGGVVSSGSSAIENEEHEDETVESAEKTDAE